MAKKALIAMSGGVDSSVAAYLMLQRGYDCTGVTLRLFDNPQENPDEKTCCSLDSTEDARSVCRRLGIPFFVYNFTESFENAVI
ncbi:MAG: tRNA 2-thiouridine(34) synthase MnmA, partial [Ruminococcus sp.]|nr:tRNA 2-thiouridine(34) synthase MnmA [Ruminococcus sp.]